MTTQTHGISYFMHMRLKRRFFIELTNGSVLLKYYCTSKPRFANDSLVTDTEYKETLINNVRIKIVNKKHAVDWKGF